MTAPRSGSVHEVARAKLNVGLRVLGRRSDGYHDLDSYFVHLDFGDDLTFVPASDGDTLARLPAGDPLLDPRPLELGGENLVLRTIAAYRAAAAAHGVAVPPLHATLVKRIPWGAGLGGGSADAGATLRALARAYPAGIDGASLAARLGSDVPFAFSDAAAARVGGRGERLTPLPVVARPLLLVTPPVAVSPAEAFAWWGSAGSDVPPPDWDHPVNALQGPVAARVPLVRAALQALAAVGASKVAMSGSGSTCFAFAPDHATALAWGAAIARAQPTFWLRAASFGGVSSP
jgi:4-diphosphocytidyl-2-C-methyl-D-erythritol kinase